MRTRQKRIATDTWRSLGCRTTPLEHWSRRKPTVEPRWAKQQTKKLRPKPTKINSFMSGPSLSLTPDPPLKSDCKQPLSKPACHKIYRVMFLFLNIYFRLHSSRCRSNAFSLLAQWSVSSANGSFVLLNFKSLRATGW